MNKLQEVEYHGTLVLTTQQIAEAYGANTDTITKNFNRNKERYIEGKHYICLEGDALKTFKTNGQIDLSLKINRLYLWTEKGAFLHAKSLNTDKAWEVYDRLVDEYFHKRTEISLSGISKELQAVIVVDKRVTQVEQKVDTVKQDLDDFKMDLPLLGIEIDRITSAVRRKGTECLGGKGSNAYKDKSLRARVYRDIHGELRRQFSVTTYKAIKRNQCDTAIAIINAYQLPYALAEEVYYKNAQINLWEDEAND